MIPLEPILLASAAVGCPGSVVQRNGVTANAFQVMQRCMVAGFEEELRRVLATSAWIFGPLGIPMGALSAGVPAQALVLPPMTLAAATGVAASAGWISPTAIAMLSSMSDGITLALPFGTMRARLPAGVVAAAEACLPSVMSTPVLTLDPARMTRFAESALAAAPESALFEGSDPAARSKTFRCWADTLLVVGAAVHFVGTVGANPLGVPPVTFPVEVV